uniref:Netrin 5 n=1 Tax=Callorhinchus milii TaxID=7868 RepID=A0A4W3IY84_CALMI
ALGRAPDAKGALTNRRLLFRLLSPRNRTFVCVLRLCRGSGLPLVAAACCGTAAVGERSGGACGAGRACHPTFEDLLQELESFPRHRGVSANSTCGREPERYRRGEEQTETCDASRPDLRHPLSSICDGLSRRSGAVSLGGSSLALAHSYPDLGSWWQSERGVSPVHVQLSLTHRFLFARTELAFVSQRPDSLVLEASADQGHSWKVWQYLAHDCSLSFPHIPTQPDPSHWDPTVPHCDQSYFARETSLQGSRLQYQRVMSATGCLARAETHHRHRAQESPQSNRAPCVPATCGDSYVVVVVGGGDNSFIVCVCVCVSAAPQNKAECECEHGTTGAHCQHCLPLLNQQPWAMAMPEGGSCVTDCGCAGRALSCYFDAVKGFGVCENCSENTTGEKCHLCRPSYYSDPDNTSRNLCTSCNCAGAGVVDDGVCHNVTGQCHCKASVRGRRCVECKDGFWDLSARNPDGCQGRWESLIHLSRPCTAGIIIIIIIIIK